MSGKRAKGDGKAKDEGAKGKAARGKAAKGKAGGKKGGPKPPKTRLVGNHYVALLGLVALGIIALLMLRGQIDLIGAEKRALAVMGGVLLVERLLLPVCRSLVGPPAPHRVAGTDS